jgi:exosortase A-associated hydrolase 2
LKASAITAQFLGEPERRIFVLLRRPPGVARGCLLVVPPFAEEMNKSRKMVNDVGQAAAEHGLATVVPDLFGTGDSEGDFGDATWAGWRDDLGTTSRWTAGQGLPVTHILGIRLGAALAAHAIERQVLPAVRCSVFWQPALDGERLLTQFLRLRVAAALMEQDRKETVAELRAKFAAGEAVDVAGYTISARLAADLDATKVTTLPPGLGHLHWMEVVRDEQGALPAASQSLMSRAQDGGLPVETALFRGEPFWSATEIVRNPPLVQAAVAAVKGS